MKKELGFTLIELMIVIAILGTLVALALPVYQDYVIRAKIAEGLQLIASAKIAEAEYYQTTSKFPTSNADAGLPAQISGQYVSSITLGDNGVINITYDADKTGISEDTNVLQFVPAFEDGAIKWSCNGSGTTIPANYLPQTCR